MPLSRSASRPVLALASLLLVGCSTTGSPAPSSSTPLPASPAVVRVETEYSLYTHCGVREARVGDQFFVAEQVLDDGAGNPPTGWGRGSTVGTMTVYSDGTARFVTAGGLEATFRVRPGATAFAVLCS